MKETRIEFNARLKSQIMTMKSTKPKLFDELCLACCIYNVMYRDSEVYRILCEYDYWLMRNFSISGIGELCASILQEEIEKRPAERFIMCDLLRLHNVASFKEIFGGCMLRKNQASRLCGLMEENLSQEEALCLKKAMHLDSEDETESSTHDTMWYRKTTVACSKFSNILSNATTLRSLSAKSYDNCPALARVNAHYYPRVEEAFYKVKSIKTYQKINDDSLVAILVTLTAVIDDIINALEEMIVYGVSDASKAKQPEFFQLLDIMSHANMRTVNGIFEQQFCEKENSTRTLACIFRNALSYLSDVELGNCYLYYLLGLSVSEIRTLTGRKNTISSFGMAKLRRLVDREREIFCAERGTKVRRDANVELYTRLEEREINSLKRALHKVYITLDDLLAIDPNDLHTIKGVGVVSEAIIRKEIARVNKEYTFYQTINPIRSKKK